VLASDALKAIRSVFAFQYFYRPVFRPSMVFLGMPQVYATS